MTSALRLSYYLTTNGDSQLITLARNNLSKDSPHDLSTPSFWQVGYDVLWVSTFLLLSTSSPATLRRLKERDLTYNSLWSCEWPNHLPHLQSQFLGELGIIGTLAIVLWLHGDECVDSLTRHVIWTSDDGGFGYALVQDQGGFDFGSGQSVA